MAQLRDVVATELENEQIQQNHFLVLHEGGQHDTSNINKSPKRSHIQILSSDSDFEDIHQPATKRKKHKQLRTPLADITQNSSDTDNMALLKWKDLNVCMRYILPDVEGITYLVSELTTLPQEEFSGAPAHAFESTIRMNLTTAEAATKWLDSLMKQSMCTYRHSKGRSPGLERVLYKVEMHCQHQKKQLTARQKQHAAYARANNGRKALMHDVRKKKTRCPSISS